MSLENPKIWLCLITSDNEIENIDEMTKGIWQYFDGICAVIHKQGGNDDVKNLLESRKKEGFVKEVEWLAHHGHSQNAWLFDKRIEQGDVCVIRDSLERLNPQFAQNLRYIVDVLLKQGVWNIWAGGKLLALRRWPGQQFINSIHWGCLGLNGQSIDVKNISMIYENDRMCAYSVRNEKRKRSYQVYHEVRYLLDYNCNSNHLQLYFNNPKELARQEIRLYEFKKFLKEKCGVSTAKDLENYLTGNRNGIKIGQDETCLKLKQFMNDNRVWREAYRFWVEETDFEEMVGPHRDNYRITI